MRQIGWEWVAGFFEGEGHVYWQEGKRGTRQGMCGRLIIGQKDKRPLDAIYAFLIDEGFAPPQFYHRPPSSATARSCWCWMLSVNTRKDVIRMIEAMLPWLFQKADKALFVHGRLLAASEDAKRRRERALQLRQAGATWAEIRQQTGIAHTALANYARQQSADIKRVRRFKDEVEWRRDRISRGLCSTCGLAKGDNGTAWKCRACADSYNKWRNEHRRLYGRTDRRAA